MQRAERRPNLKWMRILKKSIPHLLVDVHDELLFNALHKEEIDKGNVEARGVDELNIHAQKRLASLTAKIAIRTERLTYISIVLALLALLVALTEDFWRRLLGL